MVVLLKLPSAKAFGSRIAHAPLIQCTTTYKWEQGYDDVTLYLPIPSSVTKDSIEVTIKPTSLKVLVDSLYDMEGQLSGTVDSGSSFWTMEDDSINIYLSKSNPGIVWKCIFEGDGELSVVSEQDEKKKLLLERFQKDYPHFDFSGAELNGNVPDPKNFMRK
ncbi:conserved hypothetical protein [Theileria equi strain WA]|uniref:CS domain-containing protein n=1 Tax=Theileria equi strain WA TaxID=1537102 RepID=L1LE85_THEEQ|nr:conserved hypothetical protein [Theileria equi strain WA]EKX73594.1 conserved hypothetical protein [Theileria equi strain WA]|eukprot:XP_004833046.1 conserved hypothetical protein [Theileria equi strain WA]